MWIQGVILEHHPDATFGGFGLGHVDAVIGNRPTVQWLETGNGAEQCGLATPGRPEDCDRFPVSDVQGEPGKGGMPLQKDFRADDIYRGHCLHLPGRDATTRTTSNGAYPFSRRGRPPRPRASSSSRSCLTGASSWGTVGRYPSPTLSPSRGRIRPVTR